MKTSVVIDISLPIPYLAEFWFLSYGPKCCHPIKLQDSLKCNISRKKWWGLFLECRWTSEFFTSWYYHFGCRHAENIQNNKLVISFHYLMENVKDEVDVLPADNWFYHFRCVWSGMLKLPKITSLLFLCDNLRKKWVMKLVFCMQKLILWFLMWMVKHFQSFQNSKFATSLQYLKKQVG